ncbi:MAG: hypothetical protein CMJ18_02285, partial [Phycisphaeraceae bacterium]|nr:hypothetical protein [Phycisphaeraceae bacterium]
RYPPFPFVWLGWPVLRAVYKGLAGFDRAAHASRLDCPLLLLHGTEDAISPIDSARTIRDAAPDAALVPFEGAPHGGLHDWDPKRYLDAIDSFVRRRPIPGAEPVPEPAPSPVAQVAT